MLIAGSMFVQAEIPLDVLGVVAEFVAGAHCFGTLANLNIANHDLHDQTLPVLSETLLLDDFGNLRHYRNETVLFPSGFGTQSQ